MPLQLETMKSMMRKKPQCLNESKLNTAKYFAFLSKALSVASNKSVKRGKGLFRSFQIGYNQATRDWVKIFSIPYDIKYWKPYSKCILPKTRIK